MIDFPMVESWLRTSSLLKCTDLAGKGGGSTYVFGCYESLPTGDGFGLRGQYHPVRRCVIQIRTIDLHVH